MKPGGIAERALSGLARRGPTRSAWPEQDLARARNGLAGWSQRYVEARSAWAVADVKLAQLPIGFASSQDAGHVAELVRDHDRLRAEMITANRLRVAALRMLDTRRVEHRDTDNIGLSRAYANDRGAAGAPEFMNSAARALEQERRMRRKAAIVAGFLEAGAMLPDLRTAEERLERLRDPDYCGSPAHQEQLWRLDAVRETAIRTATGHDVGEVRVWAVEHLPLDPQTCAMPIAFEKAFCRQCRHERIAVYTRNIDHDKVEVVHAQWQDRLSRGEIDDLTMLGFFVADRLDLDVRWGGERAHRPYAWQVAGLMPAPIVCADRPSEQSEGRSALEVSSC